MEMEQRRRGAMRAYFMLSCAAFMLAASQGVYAQSTSDTIDVAGTDQSSNLGAVNNMGKTVISFCINVVAKVIGVAVAVMALMDIVKRDVMWGVAKLFVCGACFFLDKIILGMSKMGGT